MSPTAAPQVFVCDFMGIPFLINPEVCLHPHFSLG
jgi:hypothetical protein